MSSPRALANRASRFATQFCALTQSISNGTSDIRESRIGFRYLRNAVRPVNTLYRFLTPRAHRGDDGDWRCRRLEIIDASK